MNEERIRSLLFGEKSTLPLRTLRSCIDRGLIPSVVTTHIANKWKQTFTGNFLTHYPAYHGLVCMMADKFGKLPELRDFTASNLEAIVAELKLKSPGTARQYASKIKSTITRMLENEDCHEAIPCKRYNKILSLDTCPTTKPYMGLDDLKRFMQYEPRTTAERNCKAMFAVMLMTGARYSDVVNFKKTNIQDGILTYVPQKTKHSGTVVTIPVSDTIAEYIEYIEKNKCKYFIGYFNDIIRQICKNCGMTEEVTYFHGGKYVTKPKYEAMRSHLGRTSFVTNMLKMGQQMHEVSKMAGHTDIAMTSRYNAATDVELNDKAKAFINMKF